MDNQGQNEKRQTYETSKAVPNQYEESKQPTRERDRLMGIQCPGKWERREDRVG
jgi:hypothetical protein